MVALAFGCLPLGSDASHITAWKEHYHYGVGHGIGGAVWDVDRPAPLRAFYAVTSNADRVKICPPSLSSIIVFMTSIVRAVKRARYPILTIAGIYFLSVLVGMIMVHAGNKFSLAHRDQLVGTAQQDSIGQAVQRGDSLRAALLDFAGNLTIGALPKTLMGFGIVFPYPWVAFQGWVGGIVSVRGDHTSRLNDPRSATYYLSTLILQLIPYSLAIGAGVNVGISLFRPSVEYQGEKWLGLVPKEALRDLGRIYVLVIPLVLVASLWEFLSPWNF